MKFFKVFFLFFCFSFLPSRATYVVSLGGDCTVAGILREFGLRKFALPFDWMFSSFNSLYRAIEDQFKDFLEPDSLYIAQDAREVRDFYGFQFVHDFPTIHSPAALEEGQTHGWAKIRADWRDFIQPIREKYFRRIDRFKLILESDERVLLIRYPISKKEAVKLRDLIVTMYPSLNFTIIAVSGVEKVDDWRLEKVKNYGIVYEGPSFRLQWRKIFNDFGIQTRRGQFDNVIFDDENQCDSLRNFDYLRYKY